MQQLQLSWQSVAVIVTLIAAAVLVRLLAHDSALAGTLVGAAAGAFTQSRMARNDGGAGSGVAAKIATAAPAALALLGAGVGRFIGG